MYDFLQMIRNRAVDREVASINLKSISIFCVLQPARSKRTIKWCNYRRQTQLNSEDNRAAKMLEIFARTTLSFELNTALPEFTPEQVTQAGTAKRSKAVKSQTLFVRETLWCWLQLQFSIRILTFEAENSHRNGWKTSFEEAAGCGRR